MTKERKIQAIKNRIEFCEKNNKHKKIVKELKEKYKELFIN